MKEKQLVEGKFRKVDSKLLSQDKVHSYTSIQSNKRFIGNTENHAPLFYKDLE